MRVDLSRDITAEVRDWFDEPVLDSGLVRHDHDDALLARRKLTFGVGP